MVLRSETVVEEEDRLSRVVADCTPFGEDSKVGFKKSRSSFAAKYSCLNAHPIALETPKAKWHLTCGSQLVRVPNVLSLKR